MTTEHLETKVAKVFHLSAYEGGMHRTEGWLDEDKGTISFSSSWSPLTQMVESFKLRPLGTRIKVTMEEVD